MNAAEKTSNPLGEFNPVPPLLQELEQRADVLEAAALAPFLELSESLPDMQTIKDVHAKGADWFTAVLLAFGRTGAGGSESVVRSGIGPMFHVVSKPIPQLNNGVASMFSSESRGGFRHAKDYFGSLPDRFLSGQHWYDTAAQASELMLNLLTADRGVLDEHGCVKLSVRDDAEDLKVWMDFRTKILHSFYAARTSSLLLVNWVRQRLMEVRGALVPSLRVTPSSKTVKREYFTVECFLAGAVTKVEVKGTHADFLYKLKRDGKAKSYRDDWNDLKRALPALALIVESVKGTNVKNTTEYRMADAARLLVVFVGYEE